MNLPIGRLVSVVSCKDTFFFTIFASALDIRTMRHWIALATLLLLVLHTWGQYTDSVYTKDGVALSRQTSHKSIHPTFHNHFYHTDTIPCAAAPILWVVAPPQFATTLQPFLQWKQRSGFLIDTFYTSSSHCDSVHGLLQERYDEVSKRYRTPDYVLIVGDATLIAPFPGRHRPSQELTNYYTDLYYGEYTGDVYPEAVVGRLPATTEQQLCAMIDKTLAYEQVTVSNLNNLQRVLLVAGKETVSPAPTVTNGQVNYLGQSLTQLHPEIDTICFRNPEAEHLLEPIVNQIRQGLGLICYTAHGTIHGWHYPDFTYSLADTLSDFSPTIYINNCCYSNNFATDCFGVHLLRKTVGGAVGVIGATNSTLWEEDYLWNVGARQDYQLYPQSNIAHPGAIDRFLWQQQLPIVQQAWTLGDIMHAGNHAVGEAGSIFESYYWELYNLLGDPTLMPLLGIPETLTIDTTTAIQKGATKLLLSGTPNSYVAVSDSTDLLGSGWTDSLGFVTIPLAHGITTNTIHIVITKAGCKPHIVTIETYRPLTPQLTVAHYEQFGDSLMVIFSNISDDTCLHHTAALLQIDGDSNGTHIVATAPLLLDTIAPQGYYSVLLPLTINTIGQQPRILFHIALADDNGIYNQLQAVLPHTVTRPLLTATLPLYQGNPAQYITYSTPYTISFVVHNPTDDTTYVQIIDTTAAATSFFTIVPQKTDTLSIDIVTPTNDRGSLESYCLSIDLQCGTWHHDTICCLLLHGGVEDFEYGNLSSYPWDNTTSLQPWCIDSTVHYSGNYSLRSGNIGDRQTSDISITLYLPYSDTLSFYRRTSTEEVYDNLLFFVDDVQYNGWSGEFGWSRSHYVLPAGRHRLLWRYRKDESGSRGNDCVWIDNIHLPLAIWDAPYGDRVTTEDIEYFESNHRQPYLYPNPASGIVVLAGLDFMPNWNATLYDICGHTIGQLHEGTNTIGHLPKGIYLVVVRTAQHNYTLKLTIQ